MGWGKKFEEKEGKFFGRTKEEFRGKLQKRKSEKVRIVTSKFSAK